MKPKKKGTKKGFTLIELLVVIAIIAILSVVVVLTLNPAEMLRRSRDSNRVSDLSIIKTAIGLYLADVSSTSMGTATTCYIQPNVGAASAVYEVATTSLNEASTTATSTSVGCTYWFNTAATSSWSVGGGRAVNSTATSTSWIPIPLNLVSSGAPIGQWPVDPAVSNGASGAGTSPGNVNAAHFYSYIPGPSNNQYKLAAKLESALYSASGTSDLESTDGGVDNYMYEQGTNLAL
jgi:prepilin-type N-terminal cleavage/methylation domain-containing protein